MSRIITQLALAGANVDIMQALYRDGRDTWIADLLDVSVKTVHATRQTLGVEPFDRGGGPERQEERVEFERRWAWVRDAVQGVRTG